MQIAHTMADLVVVVVEQAVMNLLEVLLLQSQDYQFHQLLKDTLVVLMIILPHIMVVVEVVLVLPVVVLVQDLVQMELVG
tara:strand:- start:119 stop:358 length:240 start_codon:yes stop_codon:yes gene_type:complete